MRKRKMGIGWWLVRVGAAVALGVATTLGLAYGGAIADSQLNAAGSTPDLRYLRESNRWWDAVHAMASTPGVETVGAVRKVRDWSGDLEPVTGDGAVNGDPVGVQEWPLGGEECDVFMIGWPMRCMWGAEGKQTGVRVGLGDAPEWVESVRYVYNPLPTRVWWPGMAANIGVFAGAWLVLLAGPRVVRQWRVGRRGGCAACGYDLRGLAGGVCPECGARTS